MVLEVEADGLTYCEQEEYDNQIQKYLEAKNIKIIRFNSNKVFKNTDNVAERIYFICQELRNLPPPTPSL